MDNYKFPVFNHSNINIVENFILSGSFTPIVLSKNLQQLRNLRIDYYNKAIANINKNGSFESEYKDYCNFINILIGSKKLPNAILSRILHEFLNDYDIVKALDSNKICYQMTLDTLDDINTTLKNSNSTIKNKQISGVNNLVQIFIKNNEPTDLLIK